jgi:hypothetical protein
MTTLPVIKPKRSLSVLRSGNGRASIASRKKGGTAGRKFSKRQARGEISLFVPNSPEMKALLEKSRQSIREGKGLTHEEFWKEVKRRQRKAR